MFKGEGKKGEKEIIKAHPASILEIRAVG